MTFSSVIRAIAHSPLTNELTNKIKPDKPFHLQGASRLVKGLVTSALAQKTEQKFINYLCLPRRIRPLDGKY